MTTTRDTFVGAQMAWMLGTLLVLAALDALSLPLFFLLGFAGFLLVSEVTSPPSRTRQWRTRLRWIALLGLVGFAYVVYLEVAPFVPWGVF